MAVWNSSFYGGALPDAADHDALLNQLIDCLTGVSTPSSGTLPVGERWVVLKDDITSVVGERFVYLKGPGLSATDAIYVNIRQYAGALNIRNWELRGATTFVDSQAFAAQPGTPITGTYFTLRNITTPFRIIGNGRRFIVLAKIVLSNMACYCGLGLPFATPSEYPYPLFIGGNSGFTLAYSGDNDYRIGNFYDGPRRTASTANYTASCFKVRDRNGSWLEGGRYITPTSGATSKPNPTYTDSTMIWPWDYGSITNSGVATADSYRLFDYAFHAIPVSDAFLLPAIVYSNYLLDQVLMTLEGVYYTPSANLSTEDTIDVAGSTYLIINNTYRDNEVNAAFLLE